MRALAGCIGWFSLAVATPAGAVVMIAPAPQPATVAAGPDIPQPGPAEPLVSLVLGLGLLVPFLIRRSPRTLPAVTA